MSTLADSLTASLPYASPELDSRQRAKEIFRALEIPASVLASGDQPVFSPVDGQMTASLRHSTRDERSDGIEISRRAFQQWRDAPAPRRGEVVRAFGDSLRAHKPALAALVTIESGNNYSEALGEVQEMIDICDFAVGLSRQLYGRTMGSERRGHKLIEYWHPWASWA